MRRIEKAASLFLLLTVIQTAAVVLVIPADARAYAAALSGDLSGITTLVGDNEIIVGSMFINSGTLTNNGMLANNGTFANVYTLDNYGTLDNHGTLTNHGTLDNKGVFNNYGVLTITASAGNGSIKNAGIMQLGGNSNYGGELIQSGGTIDFTYDNPTRYASSAAGYRSLSTGTLSGTGSLTINTNLAHGIGDFITATSADSGTALAVSVTYDPIMASNTNLGVVYSGSGYFVVTGAGASNVTLSGETLEHGAYSYTPAFSGAKMTGLVAGASSNTKAAAGAAASQSNVMQTSVNHLKKRLGELRNAPDTENGIWARTYSGEVTNSKYESVTSKYSGMQMGYDKKKDVKDGKTYTGVAVSYTDADNTFTRGSGNSKAYDLALYHTWIGDSGHYYDLIAKRGRLDSDYQVMDLSNNHSSAAYKTWTDSLSAEYGYRKQLPDSWYLEPQAELTYGHINGVNYTTTSGLSVNQEAIDRLIGRIGVETGRSFNHGNSTYYATLSALHEFKAQENLQVGTLRYSEDMSGTWGELLLGYSTKMSDHSSSFVNVEKLFGKDVSSNWQINAGCRFGF